jgi:peptidyl-prolyl cis-trans isomerase B (cyclophilin B)
MENKNPIVTIEMENGQRIKAELYPEIAPNTVRNFIYLINEKFYNGVGFHRVIPGFMVQGGCPNSTGTGGPGHQIKGEFSNNGFPNDLVHEKGVLSMARTSVPDSAGSQFFIMVANSPHLDGEYAGFGRVLENMKEVDRIVSVPRNHSDSPNEPQVMKSVTVETFGVEYEKPEISLEY